MKIDIHTHILPGELPDFKAKYGLDGFVQLDHHAACAAKMMIDGQFFREIGDNCWDPAVRLRDCDRDHVDVQVLSTIPVLFNYSKPVHAALEYSRVLNDHIAGVVRGNPARFAGLGTVPLQDPDVAIREMERCLNELGLRGVEIGTHVNDWNLDEPRLFAFFEAAAELGAAVFVHPWDMVGKEKMPKYWMPWLVGMPTESTIAICSMIFGGVFERLPKLRVAFAHGGGSFPGTIGRIEHGFKVRPDLVAVNNNVNPRAYLGRFFVDALVHDPAALSMLIDLFGANRVAMGSDYPFPLGEHVPGALIESMALPVEVKEQLLSSTAKEWLYGNS